MRAFIVRPFNVQRGVDFEAVERLLIGPALQALGIVLEAIDLNHGIDSPGAERSQAHRGSSAIVPSICFLEYPESASG